MAQEPTTRALQHLLLQGFTLYPCHAAVCTRLVDRRILDDSQHPWAVVFSADDQRWTAALPDDDGLSEIFARAAVLATASPHVVCHTLGSTLTIPLLVPDAKDARVRIESAIALGKQPPSERLEAFSDDAIAREASRRQRRAQGAGSQAPTADVANQVARNPSSE